MNGIKEKAGKFLLAYAVFGLLASLAMMIVETSGHSYIYTFGKSWVDTLICIPIFLWFAALLYTAGRFFFDEAFREKIFRGISGMKERDEREEIIVGQASRSYFLFSLGVLTVLLFFSTFHYRVTTEGSNKLFTVTIGHLRLIQQLVLKQSVEAGKTIIEYGNPVSGTGLLLLLGILQIVSFRWFNARIRAA